MNRSRRAGEPQDVSNECMEDTVAQQPVRKKRRKISFNINPYVDTVAQQRVRKKRRKISFEINPYAERNGDNKVQLKCGNLIWVDKKKRVRKHFLGCPSFHRKFSNSVYWDQQCYYFIISQTSSLQSNLYKHYKSSSPKLREELDFVFANAVIKGGVLFSTCQRENWKPFWNLIVSTSYRIPYRDKMSTHFSLYIQSCAG